MIQKYPNNSKNLNSINIAFSVALILLSSFSAKGSSEQSKVDPLSKTEPLSMVDPLSIVAPLSENETRSTTDTSTSQLLKVSENKRLEASICADSMNRIAVANDRITQIFGDEGTFESQNDGTTGQVFLKPTIENGTKSLSLTLITEQGLTQDLTLNPTAKSATTLILSRNKSSYGSDHDFVNNAGNKEMDPDSMRVPPSYQSLGPTQHFEKPPSLQEHLISILKQAITGQFPLLEDGWLGAHARSTHAASRQSPSPEEYTLTHDQSWQAGSYTIHAFHVENLTENPPVIQEKDFFQPGDLALSLGTRVAGKSAFGAGLQQGKTLYVVRHRETDLP